MAGDWQPLEVDDPDGDFHRGDPAELLGADAFLALVDRRPRWQRLAACRGVGVDVFWGDDLAPARELCSQCPVYDECRDYADGHGAALDGLWAGRTAHQRRKRRQGGRAA